MVGNVLRRLGGGDSRAQRYLPLDPSTPDSDPNSLLASASVSGGVLTATLQSPGAHPLPDAGVIWDCGPLRDWWGRAVTIGAADLWRPEVLAVSLLPADTYVGVLLGDGTPSTYTRAFGACLRSDGTGHAVGFWRDAGSGFSAGVSSSHPPTARRGSLSSLPHQNSDSIRGLNAAAYDSDGAFLDAPAFSTAIDTIPSGLSRVWLAAGWVAGTGGPTAEVSFSGRVVAATVAGMISRMGL